MGIKAALPVEEYLRTSYPNLDKEYRDGELVERSLPDNLHSKTQGLLIAFFVALRRAFPLFTRPELRLKLREGLYLIPDVAVFHPTEPQQPVPDFPPLVAIEVLSLDDKMAKVRKKLEEYRAWGVPHVWLVDPHSERLYTCDPGLREVATLRIPELGIELQPADIFE
jgi:Uma2 family endonuclease